MKPLKKILLGLGILLLAAATLLCFLPARWALPMLGSSLHGVRLQQVQGTVWDGRAGQVLTADGHALGHAQWQLSRRALFGHVALQLDFQGPQFGFSGHMQKQTAGQVAWSNVHAHATLSALTDSRLRMPLGQPQGELTLDADHAQLQGGWPLQLQANGQWTQAAMRTPQGVVVLGDMHWQATAQGGVIHAQWQDDGSGPLRTTGDLQLSPLGWRLQAELQPRQNNPVLQRWLSTLARPDADGVVHIERSGGLVAQSNRGNPAR